MTGDTTERRDIAHFDELYTGRFLKAGLLGDHKATVTIADVWLEPLQCEDGNEDKAILAFEGKSAQLVLSKINGTCIAAMFGKSVPDWIGKRIVLYATADIMPMPRKRGDPRPPDPCIRIWGSPDIEADVAVVFEPPRRRPIHMTMRATGTASSERAG